MWRNVTQNLAFSASLLVYLESNRLLSLEEFHHFLGGMVLPSAKMRGNACRSETLPGGLSSGPQGRRVPH
jgi:hypothetical protein